MSSEDKIDGGGGATHHRRSFFKLLSSALAVAFLFWAIDTLSIQPTAFSFVALSIISTPNAYPSPAVTTVPPPRSTHRHRYRSWISAPVVANFTSSLIDRWLAPGGEPCRDSRTTAIAVAPDLGVELYCGDVHEFTISTMGDGGIPRCLGGDYFEIDLSGPSWKSRPPMIDHGNGSYTFKLQLHQDFSGEYNLSIVLLFRSFEGLKLSPERFKFRREMLRARIRFRRDDALLPPLHRCRGRDFAEDAWTGRWMRHAGNESCSVDEEGRYRCLDPGLRCPEPWCDGSLAALESNGWVYSAHCSFRIFTQNAAWECLRGKWLFLWGDSNHVDTIRNLLNFVLGRADINEVLRRFDTSFTNPNNDSESVRITNIFNGHWNDSMNYLGLQSLENEGFRALLREVFRGPRAPDVIVLNSGLHDGIYWRSVRAFAEGAEHAAEFWEELMWRARHLAKNAKAAPPRLFYRTTIATGGYARDMAFNPSKMEAFNGILLEKLKERGLLTGGVIDEFDMTFPWHYDNRCNDGVHYGRKPAKEKWRDGEVGHQYFVDLMLAHILLNAICNN